MQSGPFLNYSPIAPGRKKKRPVPTVGTGLFFQHVFASGDQKITVTLSEHTLLPASQTW